MPHDEIDIASVRTYNAADRASKVTTSHEARPLKSGLRVSAFLEHLPAVLKAEELKSVARAVVNARKREKPILAMLGGHVVKTGCAPVLAGLVEDGFITHLASNGAAAIHDTELARIGHTSEDVAQQLADGSFGMAADTALLVNSRGFKWPTCCNDLIGKRLPGAADVRRRARRRIGHTSSAREQSRCGTL
jgi:hypothetical protein